MGTTPIHHLPYPELPDPADVPTDLRELAEALDGIIPTTGVVPPDGSTISLPVLDVGVAGQYRAGRQLTAADFTSLGLQAPLGLWNLGSLTDVSGNSRPLTDMGTVPFGVGINGLASTAAVFAGSANQALYSTDAAFQIRTGSWGCWFRTAKRATAQRLVSKMGTAAGSFGFDTIVAVGNTVTSEISLDGSAFVTAAGVSDVTDDRWHFAVSTFDGTMLRTYVDGVLEGVTAGSGTIFASTAPWNIGAYAANGTPGTANTPCWGRIDEAFVTSDVLSEDQVRCLYCAKLLHGLAGTPNDVRLNVHRRKRGGPLAVTDFLTQPVRLHNFTAGALTDEGSGGVALTAQGTAPVSMAGADGALGGAYSFSGAGSLAATDAGLPSALAARSYGCWFKTGSGATSPGVMGWGTVGSADARFEILASGVIQSRSGADFFTGPYAIDGQWHFAVTVEDNAAGDGVKRKLYVDGRLVGGSTVLTSLTLAGTNRFRIGANPDGSNPFTGQVDGAFVSAVALTAGDVAALYAKGSQDVGASPKNPGDHVERLDASSVLVCFDTLQSSYTVDMGVGG